MQCPTKNLKFDYDAQISQHIVSKEPVPQNITALEKKILKEDCVAHRKNSFLIIRSEQPNSVLTKKIENESELSLANAKKISSSSIYFHLKNSTAASQSFPKALVASLT